MDLAHSEGYGEGQRRRMLICMRGHTLRENVGRDGHFSRPLKEIMRLPEICENGNDSVTFNDWTLQIRAPLTLSNFANRCTGRCRPT